jgi:Tfp pilus assembly protein PilF
VFGNGAESRAYWAGSLKRRLHKSFMFGLSDRESQPSFDLQQLFVGTRHMCTLFERVATLSGFKFATASFVEFVSHPAAFAHAAPFDETDLEAIQERIKHMNIVAAAQAHALKAKTTQREGDRNARLLRASVAKFRSALADNPHDKTTLVALADTLSSLGEFADADRYYVAALELDANDFALMFQYATFLEKSHKYDKAETYFMKAFYVNPNEDNISQHIGDFLARRGKVTEALTFYEFAKATDAVKVDEVFENERRATLLSAYTSRHMVRMPRWSDKSGKRGRRARRARAPAGWEWIQPKWIIDRQGADTDEEGWRYAFSWSSTFAGRSGMGTFVRRRRWIRTRRRIDADARAAATPMSPPSKLQSSAARQSTKGGVLGVVAAMRAGGAHASTAVPSGGKRDEATSHSPITRAVMRTESSTAIAAPAPRASTVGFGSSASVVASSALTSSATTLAVAASAPSLGFDRSHSADPDALARVWSNTPAAAAASPLATTAASAATATTATAAVALTSSSSFLSSSSAAPLTAANLRASAEAGDGDKLEDATASATQFVQRLEPGHPAAVHSMALHGRTVWVGLADGSVYTWRSDKKSRQRLLGLGPATDGASVTFEPVSAMCTVGAFVWVGGSKLTVWNAAERTLEATLEEHNASAITLLQLIPPDVGARAAGVGDDDAARQRRRRLSRCERLAARVVAGGVGRGATRAAAAHRGARRARAAALVSARAAADHRRRPLSAGVRLEQGVCRGAAVPRAQVGPCVDDCRRPRAAVDHRRPHADGVAPPLDRADRRGVAADRRHASTSASTRCCACARRCGPAARARWCAGTRARSIRARCCTARTSSRSAT